MPPDRIAYLYDSLVHVYEPGVFHPLPVESANVQRLAECRARFIELLTPRA